MAPPNEDSEEAPATGDPGETVSIELTFYAPFREIVGEKSVGMDLARGATVGDALARVADERPDLDGEIVDESGEVRTGVRALLNGGERAAADTELADGDSVSFTTPIHGG